MFFFEHLIVFGRGELRVDMPRLFGVYTLAQVYQGLLTTIYCGRLHVYVNAYKVAYQLGQLHVEVVKILMLLLIEWAEIILIV